MPKRDVQREAAQKFLRNMRSDGDKRNVPSIAAYLASFEPEEREQLIADFIETFTSESGLRVLYAMEKSVLMVAFADVVSDSALREWNGARNLVLEIRRIVSNG